jgi:sugar-specific transcriptional regulator TrmB
MQHKHQKQLEAFGLSEKEACVYILLLQSGAGTASEIAKLTKLNRSTTYVQLTSLIKHGLLSSYKIKKKTYFTAESPQNLERLLEKKIAAIEVQKETIEIIVPDLLEYFLKNDAKPAIRTFEGKDGFMTMRNELLTSGVSEYHAAYSFDDLYAIFSVEELMEFSRKRAGAGIHAYVLYNKTGRDAVQVPPQDLRRIAKAAFAFSADLYVYGHTVSIASTSGKIFGVTIKNQQIADSMRSLFLLAWNNAK